MAASSRRNFLKTVGFGTLALAFPRWLYRCAAGNRPPNILFIMSDDHAAHAISCYGSRINRTPHLDRLAQGGMRFANCFCTNGICAPSRASILTGQYSHLNGVRDNRDAFDGTQMTLPKLMSQAGYHTALIGKWHLKSEPTGFDYYKILPGQGKYFDPVFRVKESWPATVTEKGYVTDIITDETIRLLRSSPSEKPFFIMCHHKAPHRPWEPKPVHWQQFKDREIPEPPTLFDTYESKSTAIRKAEMTLRDHMHPTDTGGAVPPGLSPRERSKWRYQRYLRRYLACIASVDYNIGRLLDFLESNGLEKNTIVVYTSDQGFFLGDHGWFDKRIMYEEALRMPLIMRCPGIIPSGSVNRDIVLNIDFAPTFLDFAGATIPTQIQGRSFAPILRGKKITDWRQASYYHYYEYPAWHMVDRHYGIRTGRYKLIHFYGYTDEWEFYDLQQDPHEMTNLYGATEYADKIQALKDELYRLQAHYRDEKPQAGQLEKADYHKF